MSAVYAFEDAHGKLYMLDAAQIRRDPARACLWPRDRDALAKLREVLPPAPDPAEGSSLLPKDDRSQKTEVRSMGAAS